MVEKRVNKWLAIQAYKHDGSFHRFWSHSLVVDENDEFIVLVSYRARVIEYNGRKWHTREPAVFICSKTRWFNVISTLKEDGVHYYANIASPAIVDNGYLKFIDYDLDYKLFPNGDSRVLDENEFHDHMTTLQYDKELIDKVRSSLNEVMEIAKCEKFPFKKEKILQYFEDFIKNTGTTFNFLNKK